MAKFAAMLINQLQKLHSYCHYGGHIRNLRGFHRKVFSSNSLTSRIVEQTLIMKKDLTGKESRCVLHLII